MVFIASHFTCNKEKETLLKFFKQMDTDNSGTLSKGELVEGYRHIGELDAEMEVEKLFAKLDIDGSGEVKYTEFIAAAMDRNKLLSKEKIEAAFKEFDVDNSGTID